MTTEPAIQYRDVSKFLFLPKTINGKMKWLITASWKQRRIQVGFRQNGMLLNLFDGRKFGDWQDVQWL